MSGVGSDDDRDGRHDGSGGSSRRPLSTAIAELGRDPVLFVPFTLAGIVLAIVDWLRRRDPIPALDREGTGTNGLSIQLEYDGYPTGVEGTALVYESLVAIEPLLLGWGLALQGLTLVAVSVAGAWTMARAMDRKPRVRAGVSLLGFVFVVDLLHRVVGSIDALQDMGLFGLVPIAIYLYLAVVFFAVPGLLAAGWSPRSALGQSRRLVAGSGWSVLAVIVVVGLSASLLAALPYGTVWSSALVAPVHAVAIVAVLDGQSGSGSGTDPTLGDRPGEASDDRPPSE